MRLNPSLKLLRFALSLAVSGLLVTSSHAAHANEIGAGGQNVFSRGLEDQKILEIHNQFAKGDYSQKKLLFIGARKGNPRACNLVGWLFDNGVLLKKDSAKALQWFPSPPANPSDAKEKSNEEKQLAIRYAKAYSALKDAQDVYARELQKNDVAMRYLTDRGVSSESILKFGLGFAPNAWNTITGSGKLNAALIAALVDSGLATRKNDTSDHYYDRFRDRITFPIYGKKDSIIGFGARTISGQEPKYTNTPETLLFKKGSNLYGVKQAINSVRKTGRVFVVEGYMDALVLSQYGVENVVASLGTAITDDQLKRLFYIAPRITFCLDGDKPGQSAAWKVAVKLLPLLDDGHQIDFMFIPDGKDPDEFIRSLGLPAFTALADQSVSVLEFILSLLSRHTDFKSAESSSRFLIKTNELAQSIQHGLIQLSFQKRVSEIAGIPIEMIRCAADTN